MPNSVQCPACQSGVSVRDDAGGTRVQCPRCEQTFIVPGFSGGTGYPVQPNGSTPATNVGSVNDELDPFDSPELTSPAADSDDDWLTLDTDPPNATDTGASDTKSSQNPGTDNGMLDDGEPIVVPPLLPEEAAAADADPFGFDSLDTSNPFGEPAPAEPDPLAVFDQADPPVTPATGLPGTALPASTASTAGPVAQNVDYESEWRVRCPHCGSPVDLKASQEGKQIRCRDCHGTIRVRKPPRKKKKITLDASAAGSIQFQPTKVADRPADPFRKSASEYLTEATKVDSDEPEPDFDVPRVRDWAAAVFGIFVQIGVMIHWLVLSALASAVSFFVLALGSQVLVVGLFPAGGIFAAVVIACGFAIMQSTANEEDSVNEWPVTLEPMEWLSPLALCMAAAGLACGPGWLIGQIAFGPSLATVCLSMMSIFILFPFVLLSMLDMQSMFVPFSPDVGRSISRCEESWGGFYFSSAVLFFSTFLVFAFASLFAPPSAAVICIFFGVGATFIYFAMIGRLAFAIGHSVNEKPKDNNIEDVRQAERERAGK